MAHGPGCERPASQCTQGSATDPPAARPLTRRTRAVTMRIQMQRYRGVRIVALVAVTSVIAAATAWTIPAPAAQHSTLRSVTGTVSCATFQGSLQITAYAYRPDPYGYALASLFTGPPNTP